jgi:hypothetical protein
MSWADAHRRGSSEEKRERESEQKRPPARMLYQSGVLDVKPNVICYSIVLDCLARSKTKSGAERAETVLRHMASSDDKDVEPNVISYNSVIKAWSFTRGPRGRSTGDHLAQRSAGPSRRHFRMWRKWWSISCKHLALNGPHRAARNSKCVRRMVAYARRRRNHKKLEIPPVSELKYSEATN